MKIVKDFSSDSFSMDLVLWLDDARIDEDIEIPYEITIEEYYMGFTEKELTKFIKELNSLKRIRKTKRLDQLAGGLR